MTPVCQVGAVVKSEGHCPGATLNQEEGRGLCSVKPGRGCRPVYADTTPVCQEGAMVKWKGDRPEAECSREGEAGHDLWRRQQRFNFPNPRALKTRHGTQRET